MRTGDVSPENGSKLNELDEYDVTRKFQNDEFCEQVLRQVVLQKRSSADVMVGDCIRLHPSQCPKPTRSSGDTTRALKLFCVASAGTAAIRSRTGKWQR